MLQISRIGSRAGCTYFWKHEKGIYVRCGCIEGILGDDYDLDRMRELVRADKDGRCLVLPCKVGDKVYVLDRNNMKVLKKEVRQVSFNHHGKWLVFVGCIIIDVGEFGKTVFITREEAEAALKGEQNE